MMPVVRVNDATFAELSTLKTWFRTKTPSETIDRIVREAMEQLGLERDDQPDETVDINHTGATLFDTAPGLSFTKPLSATVNGKPIRSPRWSSILLRMIAEVKAKGFEGQNLVHQLAIPTKPARYEAEGFKYYANLGISVQGQSASEAWKEVSRLAQRWKIPVTVEFQWRQNPKAQHPGRVGILKSGDD